MQKPSKYEKDENKMLAFSLQSFTRPNDILSSSNQSTTVSPVMFVYLLRYLLQKRDFSLKLPEGGIRN